MRLIIKRSKIITSVAIIFVFAVTLAVSAQEVSESQVPVLPSQNPNYRIGPSDVIDVIVSQSAQLTRTGVRVNNQGMIQLPMLDEDIQAGCRTERDLAEQIKEKYKKFVINPYVTVAVHEFAKLHTLMPRGQKATAPGAISQRLRIALALRHHHDIRRQVLILAAQPIGDPRAHRRASGELKAGLRHGDGGVVIDLLRIHRTDQADLVGDLGRVRHQFAEPHAALAVLREVEHGGRAGELILKRRHGGQPLAAPH